MELTIKNANILNQGNWQVLFWVAWGKPSFEQISIYKKQKSKYNLLLVNVEENIELAQKYEVFLYPTTIFFSNGVEVKRIVGLSR